MSGLQQHPRLGKTFLIAFAREGGGGVCVIVGVAISASHPSSTLVTRGDTASNTDPWEESCLNTRSNSNRKFVVSSPRPVLDPRSFGLHHMQRSVGCLGRGRGWRITIPREMGGRGGDMVIF